MIHIIKPDGDIYKAWISNKKLFIVNNKYLIKIDEMIKNMQLDLRNHMLWIRFKSQWIKNSIRHIMFTIMVLLFTFNASSQDFTIMKQKPLPDRDTIPVLMLIGKLEFVEQPALMKPGYSVRIRWNVNRNYSDGYCVNCPDYMKHVEYLDEKMKPLDKKLFVWISESFQSVVDRILEQ